MWIHNNINKISFSFFLFFSINANAELTAYRYLTNEIGDKILKYESSCPKTPKGENNCIANSLPIIKSDVTLAMERIEEWTFIKLGMQNRIAEMQANLAELEAPDFGMYYEEFQNILALEVKINSIDDFSYYPEEIKGLPKDGKCNLKQGTIAEKFKYQNSTEYKNCIALVDKWNQGELIQGTFGKRTPSDRSKVKQKLIDAKNILLQKNPIFTHSDLLNYVESTAKKIADKAGIAERNEIYRSDLKAKIGNTYFKEFLLKFGTPLADITKLTKEKIAEYKSNLEEEKNFANVINMSNKSGTGMTKQTADDLKKWGQRHFDESVNMKIYDPDLLSEILVSTSPKIEGADLTAAKCRLEQRVKTDELVKKARRYATTVALAAGGYWIGSIAKAAAAVDTTVSLSITGKVVLSAAGVVRDAMFIQEQRQKCDSILLQSFSKIRNSQTTSVADYKKCKNDLYTNLATYIASDAYGGIGLLPLIK